MSPSSTGILVPPRQLAAPSRRAVIKAAAGVIGVSGSAAFAKDRPCREPARSAPRRASRSLILAADQASERVLLLDGSNPSWQHVTPRVHDLGAVRAASWSWTPVGRTELSVLDPKRTWSNVNEAKYRLWDGEHWVLTCASGGLAAMVAYPGGWVRWAGLTGANAHTLEVLPDGNIAIAASVQDFVRIYTASQSTLSARYTQFDLAGAHGLQWDQARQLLWAAGTNRLVALAVTGSPSRPHITLKKSVVLPNQGAHDLNAVASAPNLMWVTTNSHVYQYSTPGNAFVPFTGEKGIDAPGVTSISDDPATGQVLTVAADGANPCEWCTSTLTFHLPDGTLRIAKTSLYKARWMPPIPAGRPSPLRPPKHA
ncbi:DUF6528 family protein [Streptacidiphilus sp. MAP5-3]|jgi:hypothetical protein|uniref:DUF6528 family protein n=1 Tax=unclassified Streptacidiphilus TaxID=2643834 RepID=UPI003513BF5D